MKIEKTEMKPEHKMVYAIIIMAAIATIYLLGFIFVRNASLKKNGIYTNAVIFEIESGAKGRVFAGYEFKVNGKTYHGFVRYSPRRDTTVYIGDSCRIKYDTINPNNNELDKYYRRKKVDTTNSD